MQGTSREFQEVVRGPHQHVARVEVVRDGFNIRTLDAIDGGMDADRSAANLRRFDAKLTDPTGELTPGDVRDLLAPFGTEARLLRGAKIPITEDRVSVDTLGAHWGVGTLTNVVASGGDLILG